MVSAHQSFRWWRLPPLKKGSHKVAHWLKSKNTSKCSMWINISGIYPINTNMVAKFWFYLPFFGASGIEKRNHAAFSYTNIHQSCVCVWPLLLDWFACRYAIKNSTDSSSEAPANLLLEHWGHGRFAKRSFR